MRVKIVRAIRASKKIKKIIVLSALARGKA